jgi:hypothetical protein
LNKLHRIVRVNENLFWRDGMSTSPASELEPRAVSVTCEAERFVLELSDGRALSVPYAWFPRLADATAQQRGECQITGRGLGIHWPQIDEDLSIPRLLRGR